METSPVAALSPVVEQGESQVEDAGGSYGSGSARSAATTFSYLPYLENSLTGLNLYSDENGRIGAVDGTLAMDSFYPCPLVPPGLFANVPHVPSSGATVAAGSLNSSSWIPFLGGKAGLPASYARNPAQPLAPPNGHESALSALPPEGGFAALQSRERALGLHGLSRRSRDASGARSGHEGCEPTARENAHAAKGIKTGWKPHRGAASAFRDGADGCKSTPPFPFIVGNVAERQSPPSRPLGKRSAQPPRVGAETALARVLAGESIIARPVIRVSVVALRVHQLLALVNECPLVMQGEDAWRRIYDGVSALRSDMLWLNDHAHFDGPSRLVVDDASTSHEASPAPCGEIDVTDELAKRKRKSSKQRKSLAAAICHIKSDDLPKGNF